MTGIFAASGLLKRVLTLETVIRLYQYLYDRLKFLQPSVGSLISQAAVCAEFKDLTFLPACGESLRRGESFPESWKTAVEAFPELKREEKTVMLSLGDILGASDLESQLSAIEYGKALLETRLETAREYAGKHKKLYRTLGILAGLGIAILFA